MRCTRCGLSNISRMVCSPAPLERQPGPFPKLNTDSTGCSGASDVTSTLPIDAASNHSSSSCDVVTPPACPMMFLRMSHCLPYGHVRKEHKLPYSMPERLVICV